MRLLLLLSAFFTALAGVTGTRAQPEQLQASATLASSRADAATAATATRWLAVVAVAQPSAVIAPLPRLAGIADDWLRFAERRRE